jgi:hypothetical protein
MTAYLHMLSTANALIAWSVIYLTLIRPRLADDPQTLLKWLIAPHLFRYLGLVALYPALFPVRELGFAESYLAQIAWGDFAAGLLALAALIALAVKARGALALVWIFNVFGVLDFAHAGLQMALPLAADPAALGPLGWVLLTVYLPMLMVSHFAIFHALTRPRRAGLQKEEAKMRLA